uniref:Protein translocase subunit SecY n=1 Tax=Bangia fuscopurpurea TaxID=101920 RepID=A0A0F6SCR8_BANFU|nr:preprotein translocase subunit SecY [Bangia fuscopurpurea]
MRQKSDLSNRIIFTLFLLILARLGIFIPVPGIDHDAFYASVEKNTLVNFLNIFSGGGFSTIGIFALGIVPYINSSIVMQLLTKIIPDLEKLQKEEGELGRQKITQITRYLALGWATLQSCAISIWVKPYVFNWNISFVCESVLALTAGSMIIMWLSELITEKGIGNGASLLIFQNIVSGLPKNFTQSFFDANYDNASIKFGLFIAIFLLMIVITIFVQEGTRRIKIISARQLGKSSILDPNSYLPLKLNQGGVMPIVFASASMALPSYLTQLTHNTIILQILYLFCPSGSLYLVLYCALILFFSYFYTSIVMNPEDIATNLKKMGASIPNVRPGQATIDYLQVILNRLTFLGAVFLFTVALIPFIIEKVTQIQNLRGLGATSLLILVGVAIDTAKQIQTYVISKKYDSMTK